MEKLQQPATAREEEIRLDIEDELGKLHSAIVTPISLSENCVTGSVQWLDKGPRVDIVELDSDKFPVFFHAAIRSPS